MRQLIGKKLSCAPIDAKTANELVEQYHYSHKVVSNSQLHLGIFIDDEMGPVGVLQFGPSMNGTKTTDMFTKTPLTAFELNRMVLVDDMPRNSESQAISVCMKWIKKNRKDIDWILSFSDCKEGNIGYIYQATNWLYLGFLISDSFYRLDGEWMHSVSVWHKYKEKHKLRDTHTTNQILALEHNSVERVSCKQFVYVYPLKNSVKFLIDSLPYPKLETEPPFISLSKLVDGVWNREIFQNVSPSDDIMYRLDKFDRVGRPTKIDLVEPDNDLWEL